MSRGIGAACRARSDFRGSEKLDRISHVGWYKLAENLNDGPMGNLIVSGEGSLLDAIAKTDQPWPERIDRLFLQTRNRSPASDEREKLAGPIAGDEDRIRDAIWALLTCNEFRFNH